MKILIILTLTIFAFIPRINANKEANSIEKDVIIYFKNKKDAEKIKAASFLLNNRQYHYTTECSAIKKYEPFFKYLDSLNSHNIPIRDTASLHVTSSISRQWARLTFPIVNSDFSDLHQNYDLDNLSAEDIIHIVNESVDIWRSNAWSSHISFEDFCEYILPYRVFNEPIENWRTYFNQKYMHLQQDSIIGSDPLLLADSINNEIGSWFSFATLFYQYPFDMGLTRLLQAKTGNCNHMVTTSIYALRSVGIPCAVDFCSQYGNRSSGHTWVSVIDTNQNIVPMNGVSTQWLKMGYVFHKQTMDVKLPKVFRRTFAPVTTSLGYSKTEQDVVPENLADACIKDVSSEYMPTTDITIPISQIINPKIKYAYLCVFDNSQWVPVWWGQIVNNKVTFNDMGRDIVYLPVIINEGKLDPIGNPIILAKDGEVVEIKKQLGRAQGVKLYSKYPIALTAESDDTNTILPKNKYELFYWAGEQWKTLGVKELSQTDLDGEIKKMGLDFKKTVFFDNTDDKKFLFYGNVPVGGLFLLRNLTQGKEERIFTVEDGKQIWW